MIAMGWSIGIMIGSLIHHISIIPSLALILFGPMIFLIPSRIMFTKESFWDFRTRNDYIDIQKIVIFSLGFVSTILISIFDFVPLKNIFSPRILVAQWKLRRKLHKSGKYIRQQELLEQARSYERQLKDSLRHLNRRRCIINGSKVDGEELLLSTIDKEIEETTQKINDMRLRIKSLQEHNITIRESAPEVDMVNSIQEGATALCQDIDQFISDDTVASAIANDDINGISVIDNPLAVSKN